MGVTDGTSGSTAKAREEPSGESEGSEEFLAPVALATSPAYLPFCRP